MAIVDTVACISRRLSRSGVPKLSGVLRRFYPTKHGCTLIDDFDGDLKFRIDRGTYISSLIYWHGAHSLALRRFLEAFLTPKMIFLDIGANQGEIALIAAKRLVQGTVLAFEPSPQAFHNLQENIRLNGFENIKCLNYGLFDCPMESTIYVKRDIDRAHTLNEGVSTLFAGESTDVVSDRVVLRKLDDVVRTEGLCRVDLIKIDVEGAELMVLRGADETLRQFRPTLVVEISKANFKVAGYDVEDVLSLIAKHGYQVYCLQNGKKELSDQCDALCVP